MVLFTFVALPTKAALNNTSVYMQLVVKSTVQLLQRKERLLLTKSTVHAMSFFRWQRLCGFYMNVRIVDRKGRTWMYVTLQKETKKLSSISQLKESHNWGLCDGHSYTSWPNGPFFQRLVRRRSQVGFLLLSQTLLSSFFQLRLLCHCCSRQDGKSPFYWD